MIQIIAAHICYLVAEANFEPYSDSARLCLIGADHWKHPRTYACPEAIQVPDYKQLLFYVAELICGKMGGSPCWVKGQSRYSIWVKMGRVGLTYHYICLLHKKVINV